MPNLELEPAGPVALFKPIGMGPGNPVAGNTDVEQAQRNAGAICAIADRPDVPVRAGCARPLVR